MICYIWLCNKEQWRGNNWYKIEIIVFSLIVLENKPQKIKLFNTKSKFLFLILKMMRNILAKIENRNQCSLKEFMYENRATKLQHKKTKNLIILLIFPIYRTYPLICFAIHSKVWWHGAECTDNRLVPWNDLWFRNTRPVRQRCVSLR